MRVSCTFLIALILATVHHGSSFATTRNQRLPLTSSVPIQRRRQHSQSCLQMNLLDSTVSTIQAFSSSHSFDTITAHALSTPPIVYFLCLLSAGFGVPVSEDALCLFAGTAWPTFTRDKRIQLFLALYAGVVLSDAVTFWAGRCLRLGVFSRLREQFSYILPNEDDEQQEEQVIVVKENGKLRKRDRIRQKMKNAGDYVGFVIRFSVGTRGPLMLVTGFLGKVSFLKFIVGSCLGGLITLPLQLWLGFALGHNHPAAAVGIVGGISSVVLCMTVSVALVSWTSLIVSKLRGKKVDNDNNSGDDEDVIVTQNEACDM